MKKLFPIALLFALLSLSACEEDPFSTAEPDESEIVRGLKAALEVGTDTATSILNQRGGYLNDPLVRLLLPQGINNAVNEFQNRSISLGFTTVTGATIYNGTSILGVNIPGLKSQEDRLIEAINHAAEDAAATAAPIFVTAITDMSIADGSAILFGGVDSAATHYLRENTYQQLFTNYEPRIETALQTVKVGNNNVVDEYESFVSQYNNTLNTSIPGFGTLGSLMNLQPVLVEDLSAYSTRKGLDGLFLKVADEEKNIRENPLARVTDLLRRVFSLLD